MEGRQDDRRTLGLRGEEAAVRYLSGKKYEILARGFRVFRGEIDIVARDRGTIVFCEVKTRRSLRYGFPEDAVTRDKEVQLRKLAAGYLARTRQVRAPCRFDVISVRFDEDGRSRIEHFRDAF